MNEQDDMSEATEVTEHQALTTLEKAAIAASTGIVLAGLVFWITQIQAVLETIELVYG